MASKIGLYNQALVEHLGERRLVSLTESREARRAMDDAWDGGTIRACLSAGLWNFAIHTVMYEASPSIEPDFGYRYAFNKPTDWVRTVAIAADENFTSPLMEFNDEAGYWWANLDTIYARYISDDAEYGMNIADWPSNFEKYVAASLAKAACGRITGSKSDKEAIAAEAEKLLSMAKSTDAMDEGAKFPPTGSWVRSRSGSSRRDGGSRTRLIG
jgi:hypothetical protein